MVAYYSEYDPKAAASLRELIKQGLIADGEVDERDLWDVTPVDLRRFDQVHLCAGIGVWSHSLRRAGWPDDEPVWTGSFPCQPFSAAGKGGGFLDERHLWPAGFHLISECRPGIILGEQVANKTAEPWLDLVQADLEGLGYAFGACAFPSAGVGAPHIRDRTYWVADAKHTERRAERSLDSDAHRRHGPGRSGDVGGLADDDDEGLEGRWQPGRERAAERPAGAGGVAVRLADDDDAGLALGSIANDGRGTVRVEREAVAQGLVSGGLAIADSAGRQSGQRNDTPAGHRDTVAAASDDDRHGQAGPTNGLWRDADWLFCRDGKWRPVEPGTFPLAHGAPARVGRLRGYGNAINAEAATVFIEAYLDTQTIEG